MTVLLGGQRLCGDGEAALRACCGIPEARLAASVVYERVLRRPGRAS